MRGFGSARSAAAVQRRSRLCTGGCYFVVNDPCNTIKDRRSSWVYHISLSGFSDIGITMKQDYCAYSPSTVRTVSNLSV